jgi:curli production assembly/transport component CsgG
MNYFLKSLVLIGVIGLLNGCAAHIDKKDWSKPEVARTPLQDVLKTTPQLDGDKITIAVYSFKDLTGQRKPNDKFSQLSSAVTQGSEVWVINALQKVGDGSWFIVVERVGLDNLVKERQLIRSTREVYEGEKAVKLKPMLFAGLILEGGVVGYDTNLTSGGVGARYFGIGANTQYRTDQVTVAMRVVSVQSGEVLLSVATEKTIASHKSGADIFRFLDLGTKALEIETGAAVNEPTNYAVRTAIEAAVIQIVLEGEKKGLWKFKNNDPKKEAKTITTGDENDGLKSNMETSK